MEKIIYIALLVGAISFTITTTSIFLSVRELISKWGHKLEELIHCPWCLSHYIAAIVLLITKDIILFTDIWIINFILTLFVIVAGSGLFHAIILVAYKPVAENMVRRQIAKMKKQS